MGAGGPPAEVQIAVVTGRRVLYAKAWVVLDGELDAEADNHADHPRNIYFLNMFLGVSETSKTRRSLT